MKWRARWGHVVVALAVIAAAAIAAPAFGGPSLKKLVRMEVAKQIGKASGPPGANGVDGTARAYARVFPQSLDDCTGGCTFDHSKGVTSVIRSGTGFYCVIAPGISDDDVAVALTVDWGLTSDPEGNARAMFHSTAGDACPAGAFGVVTERQVSTPVRNPGDNGIINVAGNAAEADNVGFEIVIP